MRKAASTAIAVLGLALLAIPATASAAPTVKFKATAVPIPGFKHTGNILGAGAAVNAEYTIAGTEYFGAPAPLEKVNFYLPSGVKLHPKGFKTCAVSQITERKDPRGCPHGSAAGPVGSVLGSVQLVPACEQATEKEKMECEERQTKEQNEHTFTDWDKIPEKATIESFYIPGGGLMFFTYGAHPVLLEITSTGHYTNVNGGGGHGPIFHAQVPLVESLPGAPYASVEKIDVKVGSAYKKGKKSYYYGTLPTKCHHYLPVKTELVFAAVNGLSSSTVKAEYHAPCPRK